MGTINIFVGNLPFAAEEDGLRELFQQQGSVHSVRIITDRDSGRSRGFGFVEMPGDVANTAIEALTGVEFQGRPLRVNEARPRDDDPHR